jgi:hypothetical protein
VYAARGTSALRPSSSPSFPIRAEASETNRKSSSKTVEKRSNTSVTPPDADAREADAREADAFAAGAMTHEQSVRGRYSPFAPLPSVMTPARATSGRDASWPQALGRDEDASALAVAFERGGGDAAASTVPRIVATSTIAAEATRVMAARYSVTASRRRLSPTFEARQTPRGGATTL